nr:MAG TPA: hypothetical protein [Bacteriophage sp.]
MRREYYYTRARPFQYSKKKELTVVILSVVCA